MKQNEPREFVYEREMLAILGEAKVAKIKEYKLENVFDDLYDYYFEYSRDEVKAIQEAYDMIFNFERKAREEIAMEVLASYIFKYTKKAENNKYGVYNAELIYADTDSIRCKLKPDKIAPNIDTKEEENKEKIDEM